SYIEKIVTDIVTRYDVDGVHFDDYFSPIRLKAYNFPMINPMPVSAKGKSVMTGGAIMSTS
ncbi:MAG: family 10 glycosylhydrolase, partial [Muribaculaceae bacterium]|nr:family 10 glycosylhydrolase [Muribaculaceae bacterium]